MNLIIKRKHCAGTSFDNMNDDPITRAINEQYPEFPIKHTFADFFIDKYGTQYLFNTSEINGYCRNRFKQLRDGLIQSINLLIQVDHTRRGQFKLLGLISIALLFMLTSCYKQKLYIENPTCQRVKIFSDKYHLDSTYWKTDSIHYSLPYQDYACNEELEKIRKASDTTLLKYCYGGFLERTRYKIGNAGSAPTIYK